MARGQVTPIIRKKKVRGHGRHHGGAWKVAFADFMTAMFTLFLVLWLVNQTTDIKDAIANYFRDPIGFTRGGARLVAAGMRNGPPIPKPTNSAVKLLTTRPGINPLLDRMRNRFQSTERMRRIAEQVHIDVTPDGLRISLVDNAEMMFFRTGSAELAPAAHEVLRAVGAELASLPHPVFIEGHTDARAYGAGAYTNWELSTDRAHAARRILVDAGLAESMIAQVRGFADRDPAVPDDPYASGNRRITITVFVHGDAPQ